MNVERIIPIMAGSFILISLALGARMEGSNPLFQHEYWLFLAAFVGFNLFQSGFTNFCPAALILKQMGVSSCCANVKAEVGRK